jgi:predicted NUDIX family NTP pyrophosphohydrolase
MVPRKPARDAELRPAERTAQIPRCASEIVRQAIRVTPGRFSAGLLLYRRGGASLEVLLVHPGGPLWAKRDRGAWSVPKGEPAPGEPPLAAALREFAEELGSEPNIDLGELLDLGTVRQRNGKIVAAWAASSDFDHETMKSNSFEMEWPPRSGVSVAFPEVDRAAWFELETAMSKILFAQTPFITRLSALLG